MCGLPLTKTRREEGPTAMTRPDRGRVQEERERADFRKERGGHKLRRKGKPISFSI